MTVLKPLSFTSFILFTMQLIIGLPLFFSLLTSVLHSTQLTTPLYSIVSIPVSASWVPLAAGLSPIFFSHFRLLFLFYITFILWCSPDSVLGPILFRILVSPIASIVFSQAISWRYTAFSFPFPSSLSSSLCSIQRCVSSIYSWFLHNGMVLNPTKTEAIWFGNSPQLQSLSNLTSIDVVGTSACIVGSYQAFWQPAINFSYISMFYYCQLKWEIKYLFISVPMSSYTSSYLVLLLTDISIFISTFQTSALHPSSLSVLSAIFALFLTRKFSRPSLVLLSVPD